MSGIAESLRTLFEEYLPRARWWPWKGVTQEVRIRVYEEVEDLVLLILESAGRLFYLPLARVDMVPEGLSSRGFCTGGSCYVEAEYTPIYLTSLRRATGTWLKLFEGFSETGLVVHSARPVTLESTNAVVEYESNQGTLVLKSYRLLPEVNVEVKVLERLASRDYRYIPRVKAVVYHGKHPVGVLMERVSGVADAGLPFYESLTSHLVGDRKALKTGLAAKLGVIVGEMHVALNRDSDDPFFGVEPVASSDVERWSRRVEWMFNTALSKIDKLLDGLQGVERQNLEYWRGLLENRGVGIIEDAVSSMDAMKRLYKGRIHQDLHLAQMVYTGDGVIDFVVTDFEGEPGRPEHEKLVKEPLVRDIATMIRSFHYLSHAAVENFYRVTKNGASKLMLERDPTAGWRLRHVLAMTYGYVARLLGTNLLSPEDEASVASSVWNYVYPWVVERAVYELYYETMYRPGWISIPVVGLLEAPLYKSTRGVLGFGAE